MYHAINDVLMSLNKVGGVFYDYSASVFIQTALLVILLLIIDLLLRKRIRAIFRYGLWLLVLAKLILPPMFSLPTGIGYWVGGHIPAGLPTSSPTYDVVSLEHTRSSGEIPQFRPSDNTAEDGHVMTSADSALTALTWQAVLFVLWLAGVLAFLAVLVQRIRFVRGLVAASYPAGEELTGLLEECRRQMTIRREIKLRLSRAIPSPAVCGLLRPTVLIPTSLIEGLSPEGLRATLIHELAHIKRGDLWVNSVQTFLQVMYFYNPFVWFANSMIRKVCEEAVDETVLVALGGEAEHYSNTLIDIGEMVFWKADFGLSLIGVAESKKALQWRIRHMLNRPIPKSSKLGVFGIIALLAVAAILIPMAKAERTGENSERVTVSEEAKDAQSLYEAAVDGDIEQVKELIAKGADVNGKGILGKTPLLGAVSADNLDVVEVLLDSGADVDSGGGEFTPLFHPIWDDKIGIETLRTLIATGADVNAHPKDVNATPLVYSVFYSRPDIARILMEAGADVNIKIEAGLTPLHIALRRANIEMARQFAGVGVKIPAFHNSVLEGDLASVKRLVESGTDVDTPDEFGWTPLCWAVCSGRKEVAEYLLNKGADVSVTIEEERTILHQACRGGSVEIAKSLIARGAKVDAKCENGETSLKYAAASGQAAAVKLLIANGASVNFTAKDGTHPLGDAAFHGHEHVVKLLLANGADVNLGAGGRGTALHAAACGGYNTIVDVLIAHGANVKAASNRGTALSLTGSTYDSNTKAMDNARAEIVKKLIAHGADVNARDPVSGFTPLCGPVVLGRYKTAEAMVAAGADVNALNNEGKTLLALAKEEGHTKIVELLRKRGAKE